MQTLAQPNATQRHKVVMHLVSLFALLLGFVVMQQAPAEAACSISPYSPQVYAYGNGEYSVRPRAYMSGCSGSSGTFKLCLREGRTAAGGGGYVTTACNYYGKNQPNGILDGTGVYVNCNSYDYYNFTGNFRSGIRKSYGYYDGPVVDVC